VGETAPLRQHGESRSASPVSPATPTSPIHGPVPVPAHHRVDLPTDPHTETPNGAAGPAAHIPVQQQPPGLAAATAATPPPPTSGVGGGIVPGGRTSPDVVLRLHLPASVDAVPRARHALRGCVRGSVAADPLDTLELLVSELVTNAVLHSPHSGTVTLELRRADRALRIAVTDAGPVLPRPRTPVSAAEEHGRGLFLVETLAEAWGSRVVPGGKEVWCDVVVAP
jgi:anti-sigma regulatory factor (Ser/Thr protein kinase)